MILSRKLQAFSWKINSVSIQALSDSILYTQIKPISEWWRRCTQLDPGETQAYAKVRYCCRFASREGHPVRRPAGFTWNNITLITSSILTTKLVYGEPCETQDEATLARRERVQKCVTAVASRLARDLSSGILPGSIGIISLYSQTILTTKLVYGEPCETQDEATLARRERVQP